MHGCNDIYNLSDDELRTLWTELWNKTPHRYMRRALLIKSIIFKKAEIDGKGFSESQKKRIDDLIKRYRADPSLLDPKNNGLHIGTKLVRKYNNKIYLAEVTRNGIVYNGKSYSNISDVAYTISGRKFDGKDFFGLKEKKSGSKH